MIRILMASALLIPGLGFALDYGDPEAGEEKAAVCAACHGMDGNSQVSAWPKIAGQHVDYAARQTRLVRDGHRSVPEMYGVVSDLSDEDIADISAWYASQAPEPGVADEDLVPLGRQVYHAGRPETGVPACAACHGATGTGIPGMHYPRVQGQHADYNEDRLRRYRDGEVNSGDDPHSQVMAEVARNLTDEEIVAVSSYMEGLHRAR